MIQLEKILRQLPAPCMKCGAEMKTQTEFSASVHGLFNTVISCQYCGPCLESNPELWTRAVELPHLEQAWKLICPPIYRNTDRSKLPASSRKVFDSIQDWEFGPKGILLIGASGTGKSRSIYSLLHSMIVHEYKTAVVYDPVSFSHSVSKAFSSANGWDDAQDWLNLVHKADIVFLDDIGKCRMTERVESELFGLVEYRFSHLKPMLFTSQITGPELCSKMSQDKGQGLARRILEFCDVIQF
jgi:hypothetical protein